MDVSGVSMDPGSTKAPPRTKKGPSASESTETTYDCCPADMRKKGHVHTIYDELNYLTMKDFQQAQAWAGMDSRNDKVS
jgi:hypothetical protein